MNKHIYFNNLIIGYKQKGRGDHSLFPSLSSSLHQSELTILLGRNGVGKSTLLRTLVGLQPPLSGTLEVMGRSLHNYTDEERAALIGYVSTERIAVANMRVFDLVALGRQTHTNWIDKLTKDDVDEVEKALAVADIVHLASKDINHLSDGELQRVMVARTLAQNAPIIVLDEPTAFLDLPNKFELLLLLRRLAHQQQKTILLSTHDLDIAMRMADNILLMTPEGLHEGAPEDLALNKQLNGLLNGTRLNYDYSIGNIIVDLQADKILQLVCHDEFTRFWIQKALQRFGYNITDEPCNLKLTAEQCGKNGFQFKFVDGKGEHIFDSIYEMTHALRYL